MRLFEHSPAAAVLCLVLGASCATPGHVKAVKTANRLDALAASVDDLRARVTATSETLAELVAKKDVDAAAAFRRFEAAVKALESAQRRSEARVAGVRAEAERYFVTWKEQASTISDEDLKERSEERRVELSDAVDDVEDAMEPAKEALDAYRAKLDDTLKYLSIDLSPAGISSIAGRSKDASKATKSIDETLLELNEVVREAAPLFARAGETGTKPKTQAPAPSTSSD